MVIQLALTKESDSVTTMEKQMTMRLVCLSD